MYQRRINAVEKSGIKQRKETMMQENRKRGIIIDCDPGHDDAMAILWALASSNLEIKAVTTVAGNQTIEKVTNNAIRVLTKAKQLHIPVAVGAK